MEEPSEDLKSLIRQINEVIEMYKVHAMQSMVLMGKLGKLNTKIYSLAKEEGIEMSKLGLVKWTEDELKQMKQL